MHPAKEIVKLTDHIVGPSRRECSTFFDEQKEPLRMLKQARGWPQYHRIHSPAEMPYAVPSGRARALTCSTLEVISLPRWSKLCSSSLKASINFCRSVDGKRVLDMGVD